MTHAPLERANRALIGAIETPPETGVEDRLDDLAARTWALARDPTLDPDQGQLARLQYVLDQVAVEAADRRAERVREARRCLAECRRRLDPV